MIALNNDDYAVNGQQPWHGTLLVIAVTAFAIFFNTALAKKLPLVEGLLLVLHVVGFFAIIIGEIPYRENNNNCTNNRTNTQQSSGS